MHELKTTEFKELFSDQVTKDGSYVENCTIETDLEIFIPDTYISDIVERLNTMSSATKLPRRETEVAIEGTREITWLEET